jgi:hypothetical protein
MRWLAAVAGLLVLAGAAQAQQRIGSSGGFSGTSSSGGFGGSSSSSGGFSGSGTFSGGMSSSSGFSGGSSSSGSFSGSGTFSGGISSGSFLGSSSGGGRGGSGSSSYGQTSPFGRFYGSPTAAGYSSTSGSSASSSSPATQSIRAYPQTLSFGQPLVNQSTLSRSGQQLGTTGLGQLGTSGLTSQTQTRPTGASSAGLRRSPTYMTTMAFDRPQQAPQQQPPSLNIPQVPIVVTPIQPAQLQATISGSTRLPSRGDVKVDADDQGTVTLRGNVGSERERRLAEAMMRMQGATDVQNELRRPKRGRTSE